MQMNIAAAQEGNSTHPPKLPLKRVKFILNFDATTSYYNGQWAKINGFRLGFELFEKYRFGYGFYNMPESIHIPEFSLYGYKSSADVSLRYNTIFFDYVVWENYRWEFSVPITYGTGIGTVRLDSELFNGNQIRGEIRGIGLGSVSGFAQYKILPWLGVGMGLGYRQIFFPNEKFRKTFNSPFYAIRLKIFLGKIIGATFRTERHKAEKEVWKYHRNKRRGNDENANLLLE